MIGIYHRIFKTLILISLVGSFSNAFAICSFQVSKDDDSSVLDDAVNKAFFLSIKNAKIDWDETSTGCKFIISGDKYLKKRFSKTTQECKEIKLDFEANLIGSSCSSSLGAGVGGQ